MISIVLLDREEVAAFLGVHTETVRRAQHAGRLPAYVMGQRLVRYRLSDVEAWLESMKTTTRKKKAAMAEG